MIDEALESPHVCRARHTNANLAFPPPGVLADRKAYLPRSGARGAVRLRRHRGHLDAIDEMGSKEQELDACWTGQGLNATRKWHVDACTASLHAAGIVFNVPRAPNHASVHRFLYSKCLFCICYQVLSGATSANMQVRPKIPSPKVPKVQKLCPCKQPISQERSVAQKAAADDNTLERKIRRV